ncbi:uncharacterized protein DUF4253 [Kineococcus xinjiangensis]|uniref:Uncharacterized protein DUF4253 n=1 Tax=Kineococcus xinjiangensis TaxID=512762 RepID=A0A2S6IVB3_9ACTN|nr:uncharacterized protein DUF4253 [Kineococcus xinjiangensis]
MQLQAGDLVRPTLEEPHAPVLWLSRGPAEAGAWAALRTQHPRTGLWPLLLHGLGSGEHEQRPWAVGELNPPAEYSVPGEHSAEAVLAEWWRWHDWEDPDFLDDAAPYGPTWPGLAPELPLREDPDQAADAHAEELLVSPEPRPRLGLVAAARGADALTAVGWNGPGQFEWDTGKLSSVVRSWEDRFGARVVGVGFASLHLSVAAPPRTWEEAMAIAAEHVTANQEHTLMRPYAPDLIGAASWRLWWD